MVTYDPKEQRYPGEEKMRDVTQLNASQRKQKRHDAEKKEAGAVTVAITWRPRTRERLSYARYLRGSE